MTYPTDEKEANNIIRQNYYDNLSECIELMDWETARIVIRDMSVIGLFTKEEIQKFSRELRAAEVEEYDV